MASRIFRSVMIMLAAILAASPIAMAQQKPSPPNSLRLYVFDCGRLDIPDTTPYQLKKEDMATTVMSRPSTSQACFRCFWGIFTSAGEIQSADGAIDINRDAEERNAAQGLTRELNWAGQDCRVARTV